MSRGQSLLVCSDNTTVVSYIKFQGGTHSLSLCHLASELWEWCLTRGIHLLAAHILGEDNLVSRLLVEGEISPIRMDFESPDFSEVLSGPYFSTGDRPVCVHSQLSTSQVLFPLQGSSGMEGGRTLLQVVRPSPLRLPTFFDSSQSPGEDCSGRSRRSSGGSVLASETLVPEAIVSSGRSSQISSSAGGSGIPTYVSSASFKAGEFSFSLWPLSGRKESGHRGS